MSRQWPSMRPLTYIIMAPAALQIPGQSQGDPQFVSAPVPAARLYYGRCPRRDHTELFDRDRAPLPGKAPCVQGRPHPGPAAHRMSSRALACRRSGVVKPQCLTSHPPAADQRQPMEQVVIQVGTVRLGKPATANQHQELGKPGGIAALVNRGPLSCSASTIDPPPRVATASIPAPIWLPLSPLSAQARYSEYPQEKLYCGGLRFCLRATTGNARSVTQ